MKAFESLKTRWLVWVWKHTPNCAEMSRLASRSFEQPLSLRTRLKMRLHFLICAWCHRYARQLTFLREAAARFDEHAGVRPGPGLSAEARLRLIQRLHVGEDKRT
ncbi:MAG: zf-HC2 domain-containing protein [Verrucomicrobiia bacterium]